MIKRTKRKKRFISAIVAVLTIAFAFVIPFSAFAVQLPAPATYNFSNLTNANLAQTPQGLREGYNTYGILFGERDTLNGAFTFKTTEYLTANRSVILSQTLGEIAPYVKVGDTIAISWENSLTTNYTNKLQWLSGATFGDFYTQGTSFVVTTELLNSYIVLYPFASNTSVGVESVYSNFRINLNEQEPFEPYSFTENYVQYLNSIYEGAYNNGVADGSNSVSNYQPLFFKSALDWYMVQYYDDSYTPNGPFEADEADAIKTSDVSWNGFYLNNTILPLNVIDNYTNAFVSKLQMRFNLTVDANGNTQTFEAKNLTYSATLSPYTQLYMRVTDVNGYDGIYRISNSSNQETQVTISYSDFGLADNVLLQSLDLQVNNIADQYGVESFGLPTYSVYTSSPYYDEGYKNGLNVGTSLGFAEGSTSGYNTGYSEGYNAGEKNGQSTGYNNGYKNGYVKGKNDGYALGAEGTTFYDLFYAVVQAPITAISSMLNFYIFDVNMSVFFFSLMTLGLFIWIMRKVNFLT